MNEKELEIFEELLKEAMNLHASLYRGTRNIAERYLKEYIDFLDKNKKDNENE